MTMSAEKIARKNRLGFFFFPQYLTADAACLAIGEAVVDVAVKK